MERTKKRPKSMKKSISLNKYDKTVVLAVIYYINYNYYIIIFENIISVRALEFFFMLKKILKLIVLAYI